MKLNLYLDTEFTGLQQKTTLMSIGITSDIGATFYAELNDYDQDQVDDWLRENVIANFKYKAPINGKDDFIYEADHPGKPNVLDSDMVDAWEKHARANRVLVHYHKLLQNVQKAYSVSMRCDAKRLKVELTNWLDQFQLAKVKMVSDCLAYDWVLFNQIFGHAFNLLPFISYIPYDICGGFEHLGIDPDISREEYISDLGDVPPGKKHNALYDAEVIKLCYHKQRNERILAR